MMKEYVHPDMEIVEFDGANIVTESSEPCEDYECPKDYGNTCTGLPYFGD